MESSLKGFKMTSIQESKEHVRTTVREGYGRIATLPVSQGGGGCCGVVTVAPDVLVTQIGYAAGDLGHVPDGANMGLSCGNPTAIAALKVGEVVLDLGSGGGFDAFIAGPRVGATGRVIGVDMTAAMLTKARANIAHYRKSSGLDNVEFRLGEIEHLPVADASVDVVLSNCVINLSVDKLQVWREIARVLRSGGRVAISDLALLRPLPIEVAGMVTALIGCVAGAALVEDLRSMISAAGLVDVVLDSHPAYVDAMLNADDPLYRDIASKLPAGTTPSHFITSLSISARKA